MKRFVFSVILVVLTAVCAFGEVKDFGKFTLNVPENWTAEQVDETEVNVVRKDKSSSINVSYGETDIAIKDADSLQKFLNGWMDIGKPSKPELTDNGFYKFTFKYVRDNGKPYGKQNTGYIRSESDGTYKFITMTGKDVKTMTEIMNSFTLKNSLQKADDNEDDSDKEDDEKGDAVDEEDDSDEAKEEDDDSDEDDKSDKIAEVDEYRDENGNTRLIWAAVFGKTEEVNTLLEAGANVNIKNKWGMTSLMYAAEGNHDETISVLLEAGADINAKNNEGSTALMIAAIHGSEEAATVLLKAGADVKIENNNGKRAVDYAQEDDKFKGTRVLKRLKKLSK